MQANTCPLYSFSMCPNSTVIPLYIYITEGQVWRDPIGFFEAGAASAYGIVELGVDSSFWWSTRSIDANSRSIGRESWVVSRVRERGGHENRWTQAKQAEGKACRTDYSTEEPCCISAINWGTTALPKGHSQTTLRLRFCCVPVNTFF